MATMEIRRITPRRKAKNTILMSKTVITMEAALMAIMGNFRSLCIIDI